MNFTLTIEEATELHHELSHLTVSYYNANLRSALEKIVIHCARMIEENEELMLDPDVARAFPNAESVNSSLRALAQLVRKQKSAAAR